LTQLAEIQLKEKEMELLSLEFMDNEWKRLNAAYNYHKALTISIPDITEAIYNQGMADAFLQERDRYSIPRKDMGNNELSETSK